MPLKLKHFTANVSDTTISHSQRTSSGKWQVKYAATNGWAAIIYYHYDRSIVREISHPNPCTEGEAAVSSGRQITVKRRAACSFAARIWIERRLPRKTPRRVIARSVYFLRRRGGLGLWGLIVSLGWRLRVGLRNDRPSLIEVLSGRRADVYRYKCCDYRNRNSTHDCLTN
jgi:hypothetical protein